MDFYNIEFKTSAQKDLQNIPKIFVDNIIKHIENLKNVPFTLGAIKLSGSKRLYRIRVGDYRIIYEVETQLKQITIHYIRHRREVYKLFKGE